jgi:hypothetical protein
MTENKIGKMMNGKILVHQTLDIMEMWDIKHKFDNRNLKHVIDYIVTEDRVGTKYRWNFYMAADMIKKKRIIGGN